MRMPCILLGLLGTALTVPPVFAQHSYIVNKSKILTDVENRVAVAKVGARVCRDIFVGISERTWVKGTVIGLNADEVIVAADDPGRILLEVNGARLEEGTILKEPARLWTLCL